MVGWLVNNQFEMVWKDAVVVWWGTTWCLPGNTWRNHEQLAGHPRFEPHTSRARLYSVTAKLTCSVCRAIAQAVSCRLPTAADQVRCQVSSCGICDGQSGIGAGFLRLLRFPLPIRIHPDTIGQLLTCVPSALSLTPPQGIKKKNNNKKTPAQWDYSNFHWNRSRVSRVLTWRQTCRTNRIGALLQLSFRRECRRATG
jgi:hypothetical protein